MIIIGHRGASGLEPENTIRSFKKAEDLGADIIEIDLRVSLDKEIVVFHDRSLKRLFGIRKSVAKTTLNQLKQISIAAGREIPTLAEVLETVKAPINFHIKISGFERQLLEHLKKFSSEVLISSDYPWVLKKIRALDENVKLGLVMGKGELHLLPFIKFLTSTLNLYSIHPRAVLVNMFSIPLLRKLNKKIYVWTVNSEKIFNLMIRLGVDGIITDQPQLFVRPKQ
ncbi:MAG: glycerophosphodiester phosphodiesterase [Candidatus Doudnabacteria bacterium]|nr:glycerophosphodiester phosphodiesterase [Candidatus Doudnabacteria bacterium]